MRFILLLFVLSCGQSQPQESTPEGITLGAARLDMLLPMLEGKQVGLLVNHTSMIGATHLADTLLARGANISKIFSPEHGFRGTADAGEKVDNSIDQKTGLPVVSLYGDLKKVKPTSEQLADVDVVVFDIQDVGVRYYTYMGSLHYLMEGCAENNKQVIVLDRPNPNGHYVDGPILDMKFKSFVGMHPVPVVHGLTVGEYAQMINGERWLKDSAQCKLEVVPMLNYTHSTRYSLPIKPSPNLPNDNAIAWYPSTCLFEGTALSVGRGTQNPFELIGHPLLTDYKFQFTPVSIDGMAKQPRLENQVCHGIDLRNERPGDQISLKYVIELYNHYPKKEEFFISYFNTLAGGNVLREQIIKGLSEAEIRASWTAGLEDFRRLRSQYLIYPEK